MQSWGMGLSCSQGGGGVLVMVSWEKVEELSGGKGVSDQLVPVQAVG